jgi:NAD(P)-dependent dehydrogenase (short-subunit alcohol dehydrogenase family)
MSSVFVTGAAGGLGGATARLFEERGWTVFAADLVAPRVGVPVTLDVTDTSSCAAAAKQVADAAPDGLDAVVNFAGVLEVGPLVDIAEERMRRILDVNVLGTYRVNKAMFTLLEQAQGRVVNISSETGWQHALPLNGPYAMSKHAIEAYSDALRRELMFAGVRVVVIQPGPFRTSMTGGIADRFAEARHETTHFTRLVAKVGAAASREQARAHDPAELAQVVWTAVTARRPRRRYSVRPDRTRAMLDRLPPRVVDQLLKLALR